MQPQPTHGEQQGGGGLGVGVANVVRPAGQRVMSEGWPQHSEPCACIAKNPDLVHLPLLISLKIWP